jgi:orotate phosphoribosyltransferase
MDEYKLRFIEFMVRSGVLTFGDFVTKSGRATPYFVNTGNYRTGAQITKLGEYYAECIHRNIPCRIDALFGPAYKGIPLAVAASIALYSRYGADVSYCFNRKEAKDHGEGGSIVGHKPADGDNIVIIEDVITAGTSVRETLPLLKNTAKINPVGLIISVDRMERGQSDRTPIKEIYEEFGIKTYPIVNVREIIEALYGREIDGRVVIDDKMRSRMEEYMARYCAAE